MYHTKMYPKFLLLPKCSKLKHYRKPLIVNKRLQVTKSKRTASHVQGSSRSQSELFYVPV